MATKPSQRKSQQACVHRYVKAHYMRVGLNISKEIGAQIRSHAEARGESLNGFFTRAALEQMKRDAEEQEART